MKFISTPNVMGDQVYYKEWNKMTKNEEITLAANKTAVAFEEYINCLAKFKHVAGLNSVDNPYEICTAMSDKSGRIARYVKHAERKDPKGATWRHELLKSLTGFLSYAEMIIQKYNMINVLHPAMMQELMDSIQQHAIIEDHKNNREHLGCRNNDISEADKIELANNGKLKRDGVNQ